MKSGFGRIRTRLDDYFYIDILSRFNLIVFDLIDAETKQPLRKLKKLKDWIHYVQKNVLNKLFVNTNIQENIVKLDYDHATFF